MPAKGARRLVVDASVAHAAGGETATAPTSTRCRDFLLTLRRETRCQVVMPPKLSGEWRSHESLFARTWRVAMVARGRVIFDRAPPDAEMRFEIENAAAVSPRYVAAMRKDFHLIEAAVATDRTVVSLDETVRHLFGAAAASVAAIKKVVWVNPDFEAERPLTWLKGGAKPERARMLGHAGRGR